MTAHPMWLLLSLFCLLSASSSLLVLHLTVSHKQSLKSISRRSDTIKPPSDSISHTATTEGKGVGGVVIILSESAARVFVATTQLSWM